MANSGSFKKGHKKLGGRPKGGANKATVELKAAILAAYDRLGGVDYLVRVGNEHPVVFCALLGKLLPAEIKADLGASGIELVIRDFTGRTRPSEGPVIEGEVVKEGENAGR